MNRRSGRFGPKARRSTQPRATVMSSRPGVRTGAALGAVLVAVGLVGAQEPRPTKPAPTEETAPPPETTTPAVFDLMIDALDSPDWATREGALRRIVENPNVSLERLENALRRDDLSLEQRLRLERAAVQRFAGHPKGAMGVQFQRNPILPDRVLLSQCYPPFDSVDKLQPGDLIAAVDGVETRGPYAVWEIRGRVFSRVPGEELPLVIYRNGERLRIDLELGSYGDLPNQGALAGADLARAWTTRAERLGMPRTAASAGGAADVPEPEGGWRENSQRQIADAAALEQRQRELLGGDDTNGIIVGGGVPRGGLLHADNFAGVKDRQLVLWRNNQANLAAIARRQDPFLELREQERAVANLNRTAAVLAEELALIDRARGQIADQRGMEEEHALLTSYRASIVAEARDRGEDVAAAEEDARQLSVAGEEARTPAG